MIMTMERPEWRCRASTRLDGRDSRREHYLIMMDLTYLRLSTYVLPIMSIVFGSTGLLLVGLGVVNECQVTVFSGRTWVGEREGIDV